MCVTNKQLFDRGFWNSFNQLMSLKSLPIKDKLSLVKTRRVLVTHFESVQEAIKTASDTDIEVIMKEDYSFKVNKIGIQKVEKDLASSDIYNLEFLLKGV